MSGTADIGDFELSRTGALTVAALTDIPGYQGVTDAGGVLSAFNNAAFGTTWIVRTSAIPTIVPVGAKFQKLTQTAQVTASVGLAKRLIQAGTDTLNLNVATHPFIGTLVVTGGADTIQVTGTLRDGVGNALVGTALADPTALVNITFGGITGQTSVLTIATGTIQAQVGGAATFGVRATILSGAAGAFDCTLTYAGSSGTVPVVIEYRGLILATTATVT